MNPCCSAESKKSVLRIHTYVLRFVLRQPSSAKSSSRTICKASTYLIHLVHRDWITSEEAFVMGLVTSVSHNFNDTGYVALFRAQRRIIRTREIP
jgi:hypothetical protein